jgi:hypothetical protein
MTAVQDADAKLSLDQALDARGLANYHKQEYADCYLRYVRDALQAGWSWRRIGEGLGISEQAVKRYWEAHRQRAGRL